MTSSGALVAWLPQTLAHPSAAEGIKTRGVPRQRRLTRLLTV